MSVVTRWRRTFSSRVTHFTEISGFLAVNSLVSPCIRIMSPLFTVAMVRVVWAMEGAAPNKVAAPRRALRTCFTVTSLIGVEHMLTLCNYVHTESQGCQGSESHFGTGPAGWRRCSNRGTRRIGPRATPRRRDGLEGPVSSLRLEDGACRRLVGDQPVEEPPLQRRPDRRNLGTTDRSPDGQR